MAVKLESTIHRWTGRSDDARPTPGEYFAPADRILTAGDVPPGSTFKDDRGRIYTWDGVDWHMAEAAQDTVRALVVAIGDLRLEVAQLRLGLIEKDGCSEVSVEDALAVIAAGSL